MTAPLSVASRRVPARLPALQRLAVAALVALLTLAMAAGWLLWDNRRLDVSHYEVGLAQLPAAADGLRIAQVSDLHAASFGTFPQRLLAGVEAAQPDLIAITGDLVDRRTADLTLVLTVAGDLQEIAPTYFVLGNHEADSERRDELIAGLEDRGVVVLRDAAVTVELAGTELSVIGLDDPRVRGTQGRPPRPPGPVLAGLESPAGTPRILLAHRPELLEEYAASGVDLVLSGHAHGGQVRLPLLGGLYAPHEGWLPELSEGVHTRGGTTMVISRGLGNSTAGVRVNNPRELVVVELRAR
ncbi:metallophosphoesterase [Brachybacterium sp. UNK5269]|uniref:metallophosphoesterase n=1 Tax=Brachybacterium sp. UNK5269 TaxID=3408576 RepID=UPI003BAFC5DE